MSRKVIVIALLLGALGIVLGAFGAHGLKNLVTLEQVDTFEVGVRYQMYHVLFLVFVGLCDFYTVRTKKTILTCTLLGMLFFCGSIYLLTFKDLIDIKLSLIGPITPIGGVLFICAWLVAAIQAIKSKNLIK